jgi:hypothetical protein
VWLAAALAVGCLVSFLRRGATCTGEFLAGDENTVFYQDWRPLLGTSPELDRALALPAVATATLLSSRRDWFPFLEAGSGWPHAGTRVYALGPFRLRTRYWETSLVEDFTVEDPMSCSGEPLTFSNLVAGPATLREDKSNGRYAITFLDADGSKSAALVFHRSSGTTRWPFGTWMVGCALLIGAIRSLFIAGRYFRKGGLISWRAGQLAEDGLIHPEDGFERVRPVGAEGAPGRSVLFLDGAPEIPTYRTAGGRAAARLCFGSRDAVRAHHLRFAHLAVAFSLMACATFVLALLPWLR